MTRSETFPVLMVGLILVFCEIGYVTGAKEAPLADKEEQGLVVWDPESLVLVAPGGSYGRMIRLPDDRILCSFETWGRSCVTVSEDEGRTWSEAIVSATFAHGAAANPEVLVLHNGWIMQLVNERPHDRQYPFAMRSHISKDSGETWNRQSLVYEGDTDPHNGCWEPAGLQLPSGEIQVFFANEKNYPHSHEQEITMARSTDNGLTWSEGQAVAFVPGARDGMPVPLLLKDGKTIIVSIEDNRPGRNLQPSIFSTSMEDNWNQPTVGLDSPLRWQPLVQPLPPDQYAGAPYVCQMPTGTTLLSCQIGEGPRRCDMKVFVGDSQARNFTGMTQPFPTQEGHTALWNSLFAKNKTTVTAISSTLIDGKWGLWAIDGRVGRR